MSQNSWNKIFQFGESITARATWRKRVRTEKPVIGDLVLDAKKHGRAAQVAPILGQTGAIFLRFSDYVKLTKSQTAECSKLQAKLRNDAARTNATPFGLR